MRLKAVLFDDAENPTSATVNVGWDELALIAALLGALSPAAVAEVLGARWVDAFEEGAGASTIFNLFHENGIDDVLPRQDGNLLLLLGQAQERRAHGATP